MPKTNPRHVDSLANRKFLHDYLVKNATVTISVEVDDTPVRGNALASGDDAEDMDAAIAAVKLANEKHAQCVEYSYARGGFVQTVCDLQFFAVCAEREAAEKALAKAERAYNKARKSARSRLDHGDEWAWCVVTVTVKWRNYTSTDSLGACSYADETDFRAGGYFDDMVSVCCTNIVADLFLAREDLAALQLMAGC